MHLLLIEDDLALRTTLQRSLVRASMRVDLCGDGARALELWKSLQPDVVVLDLSLPGKDGLAVLQDARRDGLETPVLILTARGTVGDRIMGLNAGADDYLPKPFDLDELEARIRALHRRNAPVQANTQPELRAGRLHYDREAGAIYLDHKILELPPREIALLRAATQRDRTENPVSADPEGVPIGELPVGFSQRATPFLELMQRTLASEGYVMWEAPSDFGGS